SRTSPLLPVLKFSGRFSTVFNQRSLSTGALRLEVVPDLLDVDIESRILESADIVIEPRLYFVCLVGITQCFVFLRLVFCKTGSRRDHYRVGQLSFSVFLNDQRVGGFDLNVRFCDKPGEGKSSVYVWKRLCQWLLIHFDELEVLRIVDDVCL